MNGPAVVPRMLRRADLTLCLTFGSGGLTSAPCLCHYVSPSAKTSRHYGMTFCKGGRGRVQNVIKSQMVTDWARTEGSPAFGRL